MVSSGHLISPCFFSNKKIKKNKKNRKIETDSLMRVHSIPIRWLVIFSNRWAERMGRGRKSIKLGKFTTQVNRKFF